VSVSSSSKKVSLSDSPWRQASLPIKLGGLSSRRVSSLPLSAFFTQRRVLLCYREKYMVVPSCCQTVWQSHWEKSLGSFLWSCPHKTDGIKTITWDKPVLLAESTAVEETRTSPFQQARLLAACVPHSGDWFLSLSITACRLYGLTTRPSASPWH